MTTQFPSADERLYQAHRLLQQGQALQAESLYAEILRAHPYTTGAMHGLAELARRRGDFARATNMLEAAGRADPSDAQVPLSLASLEMQQARPADAKRRLQETVRQAPDFFTAWLFLGQVLEHLGESTAGLQAYFRAVSLAREEGSWMNEDTTPPELLGAVMHAIESLRGRRKELLLASYDSVRERHGAQALQRVDHAVSGYLREYDATPADERQRPKFFFFPGLPNGPFHDPYLHPWMAGLASAFPQIREEALSVLSGAKTLPNFIDEPTAAGGEYVTGDGPDPSWKAFFFFRHGRPFEENHAKCPATSRALASLDLCSIENQAPEVLFSVLAPGSHINAHHGVSNVRLVTHLPLIVPEDCALNLPDRGTHRWVEGQPVMFDDTFLHEAWNHSKQHRVVLLMDCWNPHLSWPERDAVKVLLETISALHRSDRLQSAWDED